MTRALIGKELLEHWLALLLVALLSGFGFIIIYAATYFEGEAGSSLESLRRFAITFLVLAGLVVCNRLVVREYQGKTQLFLESLPLSRVRMITVKFLLGLILLLGLVSGSFGFLVLTSASEVWTPRFFAIVSARTYAYTFCLYSFFFVMGFLGRYRVATYLMLLIGMMIIDTTTKLELSRFGPFALMSSTLPFERDVYPTNDLLTALGLGAGFATLAFVLALVREGSAAALMAEKMSHREKVFITALVIGLLFTATVYEEKAEREPFDLAVSIVAESEFGLVKLSPGAMGETDAGRALTRRVHDEIVALREYLNLDYVPPVFITTRRDLDGSRYETGSVESEGLLVRVNFTAPDWNERAFMAWLVRELLIVHSQGRVKREPKQWVLDGFPLFWTGRDQAPSSLIDDEALVLRAIYGGADAIESADLDDWMVYRERVGDDIAAGVAWSALKVLARARGADACRNFVAAVLRTDVPRDVRALWYDRDHPLDVLERETGMEQAEFFSAWRAELSQARSILDEELGRIPRLTGDVIFEPLSPSTRRVRYRVTAAPATENTRVTLLHTKLPVFDSEVPVHDLQREDLDYATQREGELPETYARGERLFFTFSLDVERLGCPVISGWRRQEIP